jgi:hypothetical protein
MSPRNTDPLIELSDRWMEAVFETDDPNSAIEARRLTEDICIHRPTTKEGLVRLAAALHVLDCPELLTSEQRL